MENNIIPRMRSIKDLVKECRKAGSDISEYAIRKCIKEGKIPFVFLGNKIYINLDGFIDYLNHGDSPELLPVDAMEVEETKEGYKDEIQ